MLLLMSRQARYVVLVAVVAYLVVWGVSWLAGDKSMVVFGGTDTGTTFGSYPGVLLGGLPPQPGFDSDLPPVLGVVIGFVGLITTVGLSLRRH
jgi:hypothetical protein